MSAGRRKKFRKAGGGRLLIRMAAMMWVCGARCAQVPIAKGDGGMPNGPPPPLLVYRLSFPFLSPRKTSFFFHAPSESPSFWLGLLLRRRRRLREVVRGHRTQTSASHSRHESADAVMRIPFYCRFKFLLTVSGIRIGSPEFFIIVFESNVQLLLLLIYDSIGHTNRMEWSPI